MSCDEIETRYCQFVDEVVNYHRLDRLAAYLPPDVVVHAPNVAPDLAGARQVLASYFTAFPDFHVIIDALLATDDQLLARLTATGTQQGPFLGLAPTGRRVRVAAFSAWRLRDDQCAEHWLQLDVLALLPQLAAWPAASCEKGGVPRSEPHSSTWRGPRSVASQPGRASHWYAWRTP